MNSKKFDKKNLVIFLLLFFISTSIVFAGDLKFNTNGGNVGIGTTAPAETLEIQNANTVGTLQTRLRITDTDTGENPELQFKYDTSNHWGIYIDKTNGNSLNIWRASNLFTILGNGNVGIGTINPAQKLDVSGSVRITGSLGVGTSTPGAKIDVAGGGIRTDSSVTTPLVFNQDFITLQSGTNNINLTPGAGMFVDVTQGTFRAPVMLQNTRQVLDTLSSGNTAITISGSANSRTVTFRTCAANETLIYDGTNWTCSASGFIAKAGAGDGGVGIASGGTIIFNAINGISYGRTSNTITFSPVYGSTANTIAQGNTVVNVNTTGNLTGGSTGTSGGGLNVTLNTVMNPSFTTSVTTPVAYGSTAASGTLILKGTSNATAGNVIINPNGGNVGIGTTNPLYKLQVLGDVYTNTGNYYLDSTKSIFWGDSTNGIEGETGVGLKLKTGGSTTRIFVATGGSVGIGTTSPSYLLDVNGIARATTVIGTTAVSTPLISNSGNISLTPGTASYGVNVTQGTLNAPTIKQNGTQVLDTLSSSSTAITVSGANNSRTLGFKSCATNETLIWNGTDWGCISSGFIAKAGYGDGGAGIPFGGTLVLDAENGISYGRTGNTITFGLTNTGVATGTYPKVIVDATGRVTYGYGVIDLTKDVSKVLPIAYGGTNATSFSYGQVAYYDGTKLAGNTGLYYDGVNNRLGVGTSTPTSPLTVVDDLSNAVTTLLVNKNNAGATGKIADFQFNGVSKANIGIDGSIKTVEVANLANLNNAYISLFSTGTSITRNIADANPALIVNQASSSSTGDIQQWKAAGTNLMRFTNGGLLYINSGIASLSGANNAYVNTSANGIIVSRNIADSNDVLTVNNANASSTGNILDLQSSGISKMVVSSGGNVGIGYSTPSYALDVSGIGRATSLIGMNSVTTPLVLSNSGNLTLTPLTNSYGVVVTHGYLESPTIYQSGVQVLDTLTSANSAITVSGANNSRTVAFKTCAANETLEYNGTDWICVTSGFVLKSNSADGGAGIGPGDSAIITSSYGIAYGRTGNTITLTPVYGSTANTIAQGNTAINVNTTGNLTGGTTGTAGGGLNPTLNTVMNPTFTTSVTTPVTYGSTAASGTLTLKGTSNATTGNVIINPNGGNVGIGTASPSYKLDVLGNTNINGYLLAGTAVYSPIFAEGTGMRNGMWVSYTNSTTDVKASNGTNTAQIRLDGTTGNIGINKTSPSYSFDVSGIGRATSLIGDTSITTPLVFNQNTLTFQSGTNNIVLTPSAGYGVGVAKTPVYGRGLDVGGSIFQNNLQVLDTLSSSSTAITVSGANNSRTLGFKSCATNETLIWNGTDWGCISSGFIAKAGYGDGGAGIPFGGTLVLDANNGITYGRTGNKITFGLANTGVATGTYPKVIVDATGRVTYGYGQINLTTDVSNVLPIVNGGTNASSFTSGQVTYYDGTRLNGSNNLYYDQAYGRVGIGTTTPVSKLEISGTTVGKFSALTLRNTSGTLNDEVSLKFENTGSTATSRGAEITSKRINANAANDLYFSTSNDGDVPTEKMRITSTGNIGIGTVGPTSRLEVKSGSISSSPIKIKSSDNQTLVMLYEESDTRPSFSIYNSSESQTFRFDTAGNSYLNGGNVGIGTTSPSAKLDVVGGGIKTDSSVTTPLIFSNTGNLSLTPTTASYGVNVTQGTFSAPMIYQNGTQVIDTITSTNSAITISGTNNSRAIGFKSCATNEILQWNGTDWVCIASGFIAKAGYGDGGVGIPVGGSLVLNSTNGISYGRVGNTITFTPVYGSTANTIAQGNTAINVNTTGNLTGGATGTAGGGLNPTLNTVMNPTFTTSVTTPVTYGGTAASGNLVLESTSNATKGNVIINPTSGNVGIRTTTPGAVLDVGGTTGINGDLIRMSSVAGSYHAMGNYSGNELYVQPHTYFNVLRGYSYTSTNRKMNSADVAIKVTNNAIGLALDTGNVGIGTVSPSAKLDVMGGVKATNVVTPSVSNTTEISLLPGSGYGVGVNKVPVYGRELDVNGEIYQNGYQVIDDVIAGGGISVAGSANTRTVSLSNSGVTAGTYPKVVVDTYGRVTYGYGTINLTTDVSGVLPVVNGGTNATSFTSGQVTYFDGTRLTGNNNLYYDSTNARVGIGTTSPSQKLSVEGSMIVGGNILTTAGANRFLRLYSNTNYYYDLQSTGDDFQIIEAGDSGKVRLHVEYPSGNIGVGTTTPQGKLDVSSANAFTTFTGSNNQLKLINTDQSANNWVGISFADQTSTGFDGGIGMQYIDHTAASEDTEFGFFTRNAGTFAERIRINSSGNLGIGTTSPSAKLDVVGGGIRTDSSVTTPLVFSNTGNLSLTPTTASYGVVVTQGTFSAPTIYQNGTQVLDTLTSSTSAITVSGANNSRTLGFRSCATNEILQWNGTDWVCILSGFVAKAGAGDTGAGISVGGTLILNATNGISYGRTSNTITFSPVYGSTANTIAQGNTAINVNTTGNLTGGTTGTAGGGLNPTLNTVMNPTFTTSVTTPVTYGSTAASGTLTLKGTSNATYGNVLINPNGGNVGIGVATPYTRLQIYGNSFLDNTNALSIGTGVSDYTYFYGIGGAGTTNNEGIGIWGGTDGVVKNATNAHLFVKRGTGNVGIANVSPTEKLDVTGNIKSSGIVSGTTLTASTAVISPIVYGGQAASGDLTLDSTLSATKGDIILAPTGGKVGIGTTTPGAALTIASANKVTDSVGNLYLYTTDSVAADRGAQISLGGSYSGTTPTPFASIAGRNPASGGGGYMSLSTARTGDYVQVERMRIDNAGNVGIGTTTPTAKLEVNGGIKVANDNWISGVDSTGTGTINMFKVNPNNEIEVGGTLNIGTLSLAEDSGAVTLVNMPVSATPAAGTEESYSFSMDSNVVAKIYAESDGLGGIQNPALVVNGAIKGATWNANTIGVSYGGTGLSSLCSYGQILKSDGSNYYCTVDVGEGNGQWLLNGTSTYYNAGNVGIGTNSPGSLLHLYAASGSNTEYLKFTSADGGDIRFGKQAGVNNDAIAGTWTNNSFVFYTNSAQRMVIDSAGNVGINDSSMANKLEVGGNISASGFVSGTTLSGSVAVTAPLIQQNGVQVVDTVSAGGGISVSGSTNSRTVSLSNSGVTAGTYPKVTVDTYGRVTSGTTLVAADIPSLDTSKLTTGTLPVARGGVGLSSLCPSGQILKSNGTAYYCAADVGAGYGQWSVNGTNVYYDEGNVGIGLGTPRAAQEIAYNTGVSLANIDYVGQIITRADATSDLFGAGLALVAYGNKGAILTGGGTGFGVSTYDGTTSTSRLKIDTAGFVGIGTTTPANRLDVSGNISASGFVSGTTLAGSVAVTAPLIQQNGVQVIDTTVAGGGISISGSANSRTVSLSNSGVTAGTYPKVTVDTYGRVTSGTTLVAADIPNLDTSKLTSGTLPIARGGTNTTATPTAGTVVYGNGSAQAYTAAGTSNQVLVSNGASAPSFNTLDMSYLPDAVFKKSVKAATTANISTYGAQTIDGISVVAGDRVLVKDQTTASQNGIYTVAAGTWTRVTDGDTASEIAGAVVNVDQGAQGGLLYSNDFKTTDTLGTTNMPWYPLVNTDRTLTLKNKTMSTGSTWNGNTVAVNYGGTGATTFTAGRLIFGNGTSALNTNANLFWDNTNSRLGIGTTTPGQALHINNGAILAGTTNSTNGSLILAGYYSGNNDYLFTMGSEYSSGGSVFGFGIKPKTGATGYVSSTAINVARNAITMTGGSINFLTAATQTTAIDSDVAMTEKMRIDNAGNVGINDTSVVDKLEVGGNISASGFVSGTTLAGSVAVTAPLIQQNGVQVIDTTVAGGGISISGSANSRTVSLSNSGVTAGTYPKVTVDTYGRVTSGTTLVAADIPNLDTSKLTSGTLPIARGGTNTTATPTAGTVVYGNGSAQAYTAVGTSNQVLVSNGASAPSFNTLDMSYLPDAVFKKSVKAATTANITLSAPQTIDGIAVVAGDRVLVKDQTTASQNGIYIVQAAAWTRSPDADIISEIAGAVVNVDQGTQGGLLYSNDLKTTDTLGTTNMPWYPLVNTERTLTLKNKTMGSGSTWNGNTVAVNYGGTGATTFTAGRLIFGNGTSALNTNANLFWDNTNSRLGIGTASPGTSLTVLGGEGSYSAPNFGSSNLGAINIPFSTSDRRNAITFSSAGASNAQAGIYVHQDNSAGTHMYFATTNSYATGPQARLTILNSGNVGIGTTGPSEKLQVSGNISANTISGTTLMASTAVISPVVYGSQSANGALILESTLNATKGNVSINPNGGNVIIGHTSSNVTIPGNLTVTGDLEVQGTRTFLNTTELNVKDKIINLAYGSVTDTAANGGGLLVHGTTDKSILYGSTNGDFTSSENFNLASGKRYRINNVDIANVSETLTNKTIGSGSTWNGNVIGVAYGGTGLTTVASAGSVIFSNGTAFSSDTSNFYWDDTNNRMGIGTASPSSKLDVVGGGIKTDSSVATPLVMNANTTGAIDLTLQSAAGNIELLPATGYGVGIGTNAPQYGVLDIRTTASNVGGVSLYRGAGSTARSWINSGDVWLMQRGVTDTAGIAIDASGNVGIGTVAPVARLNIVSGTGYINTINANGGLTVKRGDATGTGAVFNVVNGNNTNVFEVQGSGNVGINNTSPTEKLTVSGNINASGFMSATTFAASTAVTTPSIYSLSGNINIGSPIVASSGIYQIGPNSNNPENGAWNPIWTAIASGRPVYGDEEFATGSNSVSVYNNSGGDGVVITRELGDGSQPNLSGYWLKIVHNGNTTSPGFGGFYQTISSRRNTTLVQRFRARLPVGYNLVLTENAQGSNNTSYWLTSTAGTGKWEEYIRVSHTGNTGTFSSAGHVYVNGPSSIFTWYLASSEIYEVGTPGTSNIANYQIKDVNWNKLVGSSVTGTGLITNLNADLLDGLHSTSFMQAATGTVNYIPKFTGANSVGNSRIFDNGTHIGIGNASPQWALDINGTGNTASIHLAKTDAVTASWYLHSGRAASGVFSIADDTAYRLNITTGGSVGIGTTGPSSRLDVVGGGIKTDSSVVSPLVMNANTTGAIDLTLQSAAGDVILTPAAGYGIGIGTTTPIDYFDGTNGLAIYNSVAPALALANANRGYLFYVSGSDLKLWDSTANVDRLTLLSDGKVGIGTTGPTQKLQVEGNVLIDAYNNGGDGNGIYFREGFTQNVALTVRDWSSSNVSADGLLLSAYDGVGIQTGTDTFNSTNVRMFVNSSGSVGIGNLAPTEKLEVTGNIKANAISGTAVTASTQFVSTVATGTAPMQVTSTTKVANLNVDYLDGYDSSNLAKRDYTTNISNLAVGWYTIAVNSGSRATANFSLVDTASGYHQGVNFIASHYFGNGNDINVTHNSAYSTTPFRYIRIKEGSTYDGAMLQVYIDSAASTVQAFMYQNDQSSGWVMKNWIADATDPGGVGVFANLTNVAAQVDIDQFGLGGIAATGEIYAGGKTTQYKVWHANNDGSGSGLDADTLDGINSTGFMQAAAGTTNYVTKFTGANSVGNSQIFDNGTSVGIGTTSLNASYKLDSIGNGRFNGVRMGRDFTITNRAAIRLDSNGDYPADILFGRTIAADDTSWNGVYWSLSSRGSDESNSFKLYRGIANTGGAEYVALTVLPSGNVGIGNLAPTEKLEVTGNIKANAISGTAVSASTQFVSTVATGTAPMQVASSTTVTNLSTDMLDGYHNGDVTAKWMNYNNTAYGSDTVQFMQLSGQNAAGDNFGTSWASIIKLNHGNGDTYYNRTLALDFFSNNIYTRKREGGVASAWSKLWMDSNDGSGSGLDADTLDGINSTGFMQSASGTTNYLPKFTGANSVGNSQIFDNGTNVGIGTASPGGNGSDLHIAGDSEVTLSMGTNATASNNIHWVLNDSSGARGLRLYSGNYGSGSHLFTIQNNGNVGINVANPSEKLEVVGNVKANAISGTAVTASTQFVSTVATGTAPMQVTSTTKVANLNVDYVDGFSASQLQSMQSNRNFVNGTLIETDINYNVTSGEPFLLEIEGNTYGSVIPFDIKVQGYIYADTIINAGGISNGTNISGLVAINYNNHLSFWFPRQAYWQGFSVFVNDSYAGTKENRVIAITDVAKPTTAKEYAFTVYQSLHTSNYNSYVPKLDGTGATGTWGINITGNAHTVDNSHTGGSGTASTIVVRDAAGYIQNTWYNSSRGSENSAAASYIYDTGDGYMRKKDLANVKTEIVTSAAVIGALGYTPVNKAGDTMTGNLYFSNIGQGIVGSYSSTRYQGVFAMGDSYKLAADGSSPGTLYGIAWTHSNIGGQSIAGLGHQALFMENGVTQTAIGNGIWTRANITGNAIYGTAISASTQFVSTVATGTAPMQVTSTTKVANLNVDYLDGYDSTQFLRAYSDGSAVNVNTLGDTFILLGGSTANWVNRGPSGHNGGAILHTTTHPGGYYSDLWFDTANNNVYSRAVNAGTIGGWAKMWAENNDGSGSGLDADTVDGYHGHAALTIGTANGLSLSTQALSLGLASTSATGALSSTDWNTFNGKLSAEADTLASVTGRGYTTRVSSGTFANGAQDTPGLEVVGSGTTSPAFMTFHRPGQYAIKLGLDGTDLKVGGWSMGAVGYKIWHEGNDGAGSTLDADTLDGLSSTSFQGALGYTPVNKAGDTMTGALTATSFSGAGTGLTGTASGLSIGGNAATATTATTANNLLNFTNAYSANPIVGPDSLTSNGVGYVNGLSLFGQSDGGLYSSSYSSAWVHQIYGDFRTGQIAVRGKNSGTWQAWRTVLDSSNYTSYAPSLTGTGASGTWGINVSGSAASVAVHAGNEVNIGGSYAGASRLHINYNDGGNITEHAFYNGGTSLSGLVSSYLTTTGNVTAERYKGNNSLVLNNYTTVNPSSNVFLYSQPNDRDSWIYLDSADTASNWGIYHRQIDSAVGGTEANSIAFVGGGNSAVKAFVGLSTGNGYFSGSVTAGGILTLNGGSSTNWASVNIGGSNGINSAGSIYSYNSVCVGNASGHCDGAGGSVMTSGSVTSPAFYYSSDKSLKTNIKSIENSLSKLLKLEARSFEWKDGSDDKTHIGFIAQEVEKIFPEVVYTDKNTGLKSVEYANLTAPIIEGIKDQQSQIDELKKINEVQQKQIDELRKQVEALLKKK